MLAEAREEREPDEAADDGARQVEPLEERDVEAEYLSADKERREDGEYGDGEHGVRDGGCVGGHSTTIPRRCQMTAFPPRYPPLYPLRCPQSAAVLRFLREVLLPAKPDAVYLASALVFWNDKAK